MHHSSPNDNSTESHYLIDLLSFFMWRSCKSQVQHELNIPKQTQIVHRLNLSNLEKLYYSEQHAECELKFLERIAKSCRGNTIDPRLLNFVLSPLLKIRQCCTIPVVMSGNKKKANGFSMQDNNQNAPKQHQFLQPKQLHAYLKSANENDCKSELRSIASSYNGKFFLYNFS